jgi:hypothetical protein
VRHAARLIVERLEARKGAVAAGEAAASTADGAAAAERVAAPDGSPAAEAAAAADGGLHLMLALVILAANDAPSGHGLGRIVRKGQLALCVALEHADAHVLRALVDPHVLDGHLVLRERARLV